MPDLIKRTVGLSFSKEEIEKMMETSLSLHNELDFEMVADFLELAHANGDFTEFGYSEDCCIDNMEADEGGFYLFF